jgi:hypothetical protein
MLNQKIIYKAWENRFNYPKTSLESQAKKAFSKVKLVFSISNAVVKKMVKNHQLVLIGDDSSIGMQQEEFVQQILHPLKNARILLITNRNDPTIFSFLKRSNIVIRKIAQTNFNQETDKITFLVNKFLNRYDHILVWTGHLRLSSENFQNKLKVHNPLSVYLQCNQLYWKFPDKKSWSKIDSNQIVWMGSSPLISIDHYRSSDESGFVLIKPKMLRSTFLQMMREISRIMKQENFSKPKKILHVFGNQEIQAINQIKSKSLKKFIVDRVKKGESAVMPNDKLVLLSTLNASHISEEAAHYLRTAQNKISEYGEIMTIIEEALAFFASLLLFPSREIPILSKTKNSWDNIHFSGYELGSKLLVIWNSSSKNKSMIRKLWKLHPRNEFEAQMMLAVIRDMQ